MSVSNTGGHGRGGQGGRIIGDVSRGLFGPAVIGQRNRIGSRACCPRPTAHPLFLPQVINHGKHDRWGLPNVHYHEVGPASLSSAWGCCESVFVAL